MQKLQIKLIITDLDNTLYDWFLPWYKSFKIFIDDVLSETDIQEEELLSQIKSIHQKYGTSEYSFDFLLKELELFQQYYPKDKIDTLRHKFYKTKKYYLKLYPGVLESLIMLKQNNCKIVAYTESMEFYAKDRFRKLGLDGIIDELYSPEDHDIPNDFKRYYDEEYYKLKKTKYYKLPLNHKKPDVFIINQIRKNFPLIKENEILYIGDSLTKDIYMAQQASIIDAYAKYGTVHHSEEYNLLKKVTHWTDDEVEKEKNSSIKTITPTYTLKASFSEIFNYFNFSQENYKIEYLIKLWDRTIDVQKHFNDIELKLRQLVISLSSIFLGGFMALISANKIETTIKFNNFQIHTLSIAIFITALIWFIFYLVDRFWYHPLLKGAVKEGIDLENKISKVLPINGLTNTISQNSPVNIFSIKINSNNKMNLFYWSIITILIILGCLIV